MKKALVVLTASAFLISLTEAQTVFNSTPGTVAPPSPPVNGTIVGYHAPYLTSHSDVGESVIKGNKNDAYPWIENSAVASGVKFK